MKTVDAHYVQAFDNPTDDQSTGNSGAVIGEFAIFMLVWTSGVQYLNCRYTDTCMPML